MHKRAYRSFRKNKDLSFQLDWRIIWYSVLIWLLAIGIGGFIILPWFYLILPIAIFWLTVIYFKKIPEKSRSKFSNKIFKVGLWVALAWFFSILILDFFEVIGPYYSNVPLYLSDFRNWLKYPLVLLTPVIYSLILENVNLKAPHFKSPQF